MSPRLCHVPRSPSDLHLDQGPKPWFCAVQHQGPSTLQHLFQQKAFLLHPNCFPNQYARFDSSPRASRSVKVPLSFSTGDIVVHVPSARVVNRKITLAGTARGSSLWGGHRMHAANQPQLLDGRILHHSPQSGPRQRPFSTPFTFISVQVEMLPSESICWALLTPWKASIYSSHGTSHQIIAALFHQHGCEPRQNYCEAVA